MKAQQLKKLLAIARRAAKGAGAILINTANDTLEIREKAPFDLVTTSDIAANTWIRHKLLTEAPESLVLAEEDEGPVNQAIENAQNSEVLWIVDPIDGTTNYAKRIPHIGVSIAAFSPATREILVGCIYDPWRDECFTAYKGGGARLNGKSIRASDVDNFHFALAATGFSYSRRRSRDNNLAELAPFIQKCLGVRRFGAASLDLAWIACGRLDIYWEPGLKPWDVAAGILIVQEAFGATSNFGAEKSSPFDTSIIATNEVLHQKVIRQIQSARQKAGLK